MKNSQITELLDQMNAGDACASDTLMPLIYQELRQMAALRMNSEKAGHTLSPTGLVHEVWLKLVLPASRPRWTDRESFFAAAGEAMRRILIDAARRKLAAKRGGDSPRIHGTTETTLDDQSFRLIEILDVNHAIEKLKSADQTSAAVVNLHYFAGFSLDETANLLNIGRATCYRKWRFARAYLKTILDDESAFS
jgi:RNA polymerase sigma factor (TIGR02999 family)